MITATDTTPAPLQAEHAFLGCLLRLPQHPARRVLAGMRPDDCGDPAAATVLHLIIQVIAAGHAPQPVTVFTHARTTGQVSGDYATRRLADWIIDAHRDAPAPAAADYLKAVVLEHAWRRALRTHARRVQLAAEADDVTAVHEFAEDTGTVEELWTRYQAALDTRPDGGRLGVAA